MLYYLKGVVGGTQNVNIFKGEGLQLLKKEENPWVRLVVYFVRFNHKPKCTTQRAGDGCTSISNKHRGYEVNS